eukprot:GHVU01017796.1.p1 GENE.GHVU01017796.1~~GHVU01017796.1.p1  ORF type:complete len:129 (+),score=14.07 GHVU01017796.1:91-477(+)
MDGWMDAWGWGGVDAWLLATTTTYYYGYTVLLALPSSLPPQVCCSALAVAFTVATGEHSMSAGQHPPQLLGCELVGSSQEQGSFEVWWAAMLVMFGYPRQYCCPSMYVAMMMCIGWQSKGREYKYECQ